jgi:Senescence-associated protein
MLFRESPLLYFFRVVDKKFILHELDQCQPTSVSTMSILEDKVDACEPAIATEVTTEMYCQEKNESISSPSSSSQDATSTALLIRLDDTQDTASADQEEPHPCTPGNGIESSSALALSCTNDATIRVTSQPPPSTGGLRRIPSQIRLALLSLKRDHATVWQDIEDDVYILLDGKVEHLQILANLFLRLDKQLSTSTTCSLIRSLAYLCSRSANDMAAHDEHVSRIASYICIGRDSADVKLEVVTALVACLTPSEASWQLQPEVLKGTLEFLITPDKEWEFMDDHTAMTLLYELRAHCLREIAREQERLRRVADKGDEAAVLISAGAKLVELGIHRSNKLLEGHIDHAGEKVKHWVEVDEKPLIQDRDAVVAMAFSDTAKRASVCAREGTKAAVSTLCDASIAGLHMMGNKLGEKKFTEKLSPEGREILKAAGKIGIATVGAAAIVGEALVETGRGVVSKTADVTAEVVGHKYGATAGEVAKNAADTAENVFRTIGNAALIDGSLFAKSVAKRVGKEQIDKDFEKAKETIQMLEKHAAALASQTLGIRWEGNWSNALGNSSIEESSTPPGFDTPAANEKRDDPAFRRGEMNVESDENAIQRDQVPEMPPKKSDTNKLVGVEDHSGSDTSSLSSSVSTERTGLRIARRGKVPQRKRVPLRPDIDPASFSTTSRRRSHASRRPVHNASAATLNTSRRSWA